MRVGFDANKELAKDVRRSADVAVLMTNFWIRLSFVGLRKGQVLSLGELVFVTVISPCLNCDLTLCLCVSNNVSVPPTNEPPTARKCLNGCCFIAV